MLNLTTQAKRSQQKVAHLFVMLLLLLSNVPAKTLGENRAYQNNSQSNQNAPSGDVEEARKLNNKVRELYKADKYDEALPLALRALEILESASGAQPIDVSMALYHLAALYDAKKDYAKAEPLYQRSLASLEKALGAEHPFVASVLIETGLFYKNKGDYGKAEPLLQRALAIREKVFGKEHPEVATSLNYLALLYDAKGDYAKAEPLFLRALAIREKTPGAEPREVALLLVNLAGLYRATGNFGKAEPFYQRALIIAEKTFGAEHPSVASIRNNFALLYMDKGDYGKAEPLLQQALAIREKTFGKEHPSVASTLANLAGLYCEKGDYAKAEPLYLRALAIYVKALGAEHPNVATVLNNLAVLYDDRGDYAKAEPLYQRALAIREKIFGADGSDVADSLNNLAELYRNKGDYAKAEPLYLRALTIYTKALGNEHPRIAFLLNNVALLYDAKGDYAKAELLFIRALAIKKKALGKEHPEYARSLNNLAVFYEEKGDVAKAILVKTQANEANEHDLVRNLASGSERQKLAYLAQTASEPHLTIDMHVNSAPTSVEAIRLAFTAILQRKGRALDVMADSIAALRRRASPEDQKLLDQMAQARSQLSTLTLKGAGKEGSEQHRADLKALEEQIEQLENQISARSAEFRAQQLPITLDNVQKAIPAGAALIEFVSYKLYNVKTRKVDKLHYIAYILKNTGDPTWVELGDAKTINDAVKEFRAVLQRDGDKPLSDIERDVKPRARNLDELVMRPVRKLLGNTTRLLLSPDSTLNLLPFDALVDEQNRYLVETYSISYLTSGRDLLRMQIPRQSKQAALILADPDFDINTKPPQATAGADSRIAQRVDTTKENRDLITQQVDTRPGPRLGSAQIAPLDRLPGSAVEGAALKKLMPTATLLMQGQATEAVLKRASSPSILHISTHGGFLEDAPTPELNNERGMRIRPASTGGLESALPAKAHAENPLLRSGLFFAGANRGSNGDDDGVLTALEVAGLDLWGTKLVVLSACETGLGEVRNGDGVYGLRRALVLAGSETQLMSLWSVSDTGTRDLMIEYYKRLQAGHGRADALREVRLQMLKSANRKHPYFWASFIQSGEWANLDGKREESKK